MKTLYLALTVVAVFAVAFHLVQNRDEKGISGTEGLHATTFSDTSGPIKLVKKPYRLPDVEFVDADNRPLSLADFRGKVVLLNIWATWCLPCRKEMPSLDRLQARMGGDDFLVLPLSTDLNGIAAVEKFYRSAGLKSLGFYLDQSSRVTSTLKVPGLPATFLIDRDGRALGVKLGPAEWDSDGVTNMIEQQL